MQPKAVLSSTLTRLHLAGAAGNIEADVNDPGPGRRGIALIAHPHPLHGGTKDNKVVTTLAKVFFNLGYVAARPNFRGVGASGGVHDGGIGEADDMLALARDLQQRYGALPVILAGFSFGAYVQSRAVHRLSARALVLIAPAVNRFAAAPVPVADTLVVHGEHDDVVPLSAVLDWARPQALAVVVVPGGGHFFHGRLPQLAQIVLRFVR
jgi:alpha/beta superfamily hydrolase